MKSDDNPGMNQTVTKQINVTLLKSLNKKEARLLLTYQGEVEEIAPGPRVFVVGRGRNCNLVVDDEFSSRQHARFVYRKGKFVLIDHSTNGTFVRIKDETEVCLVEQEQFPLMGSGVIGLGRTTSEYNDHLIQFYCYYPANHPRKLP